MEKIILFLLVMGIGWLFERMKEHAQKRKESGESLPSRPVRRSPQAAMKEFEAFLRQSEDDRPKSDRQPKPSLPVRETLPVEGERSIPDSPPMEITILDEQPEVRPAGTDAAETAAHYARWRRAVIDSEILARRYT